MDIILVGDTGKDSVIPPHPPIAEAFPHPSLEIPILGNRHAREDPCKLSDKKDTESMNGRVEEVPLRLRIGPGVLVNITFEAKRPVQPSDIDRLIQLLQMSRDAYPARTSLEEASSLSHSTENA